MVEELYILKGQFLTTIYFRHYIVYYTVALSY